MKHSGHGRTHVLSPNPISIEEREKQIGHSLADRIFALSQIAPDFINFDFGCVIDLGKRLDVGKPVRLKTAVSLENIQPLDEYIKPLSGISELIACLGPGLLQFEFGELYREGIRPCKARASSPVVQRYRETKGNRPVKPAVLIEKV